MPGNRGGGGRIHLHQRDTNDAAPIIGGEVEIEGYKPLAV